MNDQPLKVGILDVNFQEYLQSVECNEFRLVKALSESGQKFYIHPLGKNGISMDFVVEGGVVRCVTQGFVEDEDLSPADTIELTDEKLAELEKASTYAEIESILES